MAQGGGAAPVVDGQRVQMRDVVEQGEAKGAVFPAQDGDGGVQQHGQLLPVPQVRAGDPCQEAADGDAVAHHRHAAALIAAGDGLQRGVGPFRQLREGLRPCQAPAGRVREESLCPLRLLMEEVSEKQLLPGADVQLPQGGGGVERQGAGLVDGGGGEHGPVEVAGAHRVKLEVPQPIRQQGDLPAAQLGDAAVPVPLHDAKAVSLRLRVPDQINFCHNLSLSLTKVVEYSII